jgi:hypothetical protein
MTQNLAKIAAVVLIFSSVTQAAEWAPSALQPKRASYRPSYSTYQTKPSLEWLRPISIREIAAAELKAINEKPELDSADGSTDSAIQLVDFETAADSDKEDGPTFVDESDSSSPIDEETDSTDSDDESTDDESSDDDGDEPASEAVPLDPDDIKSLGPFFNKSQSTFTWIPRGSNSTGIGQVSFELAPTWNLDFPSADGIEIDGTMGGGIHFLSGPGRSDLPPRVYDFYWTTRAMIDLGDECGVEATFNLGIHSDFETGSEGWRYPGRVLGYLGPATGRFVFGIEYFDLENLKVLPAAGIVSGGDDYRLELYFPRARIRSKVSENDQSTTWGYLSCEYHGSEWAIQRSFGRNDTATLSEYRLLLGSEEIDHSDGQASFSEVGWFFGRDLEYRSRIGSFQPQDAFMFRFGSRF